MSLHCHSQIWFHFSIQTKEILTHNHYWCSHKSSFSLMILCLWILCVADGTVREKWQEPILKERENHYNHNHFVCRKLHSEVFSSSGVLVPSIPSVRRLSWWLHCMQESQELRFTLKTGMTKLRLIVSDGAWTFLSVLSITRSCDFMRSLFKQRQWIRL
jgi:hypothetical protein